MESLYKWCEENLIDFETIAGESFLDSNNKSFHIIEPVECDGEQKIFDEDLNLILTNYDHKCIEKFKPDYLLYEFGKEWYYTPIGKSELNLFKYFGKAKQTLDIDYTFLGIHSGYEICNGSRNYEDWIKKAKFFNINKLGICELNTLAGTLKFQNECKKNDIKSILGETVSIKTSKANYELKLFAKNDIGFKNLLRINSQINVINDKFVTEEFVLKHTEGLICVVPCSIKLTDEFLSKIKVSYENYFYQINLVEYSSYEKDREHILTIEHYLKNYRLSIKPILLSDSYYLDKEDWKIKGVLNKIGKFGFNYQSKDQYFKPIDEIINQANNLGLLDTELNEAIKNTNVLADLIDFSINTKELHLPKYEMNEDEKKLFATNEDLFFHLIEKGFNERIEGKVKDVDIYYKRFETELDIITRGKLIDYFLILWDIINYCRKEEILTGHGRGSAAGSVISYLLYITHLDPIEYKLLFERFLNEARLGSLPDIDVDFESAYRDKVKKYIQDKYGFEFVCCIGSYNLFKLKSCIKDLAREYGISDFNLMNFITSLIKDDDGDYIDLFKDSNLEPKLKSFINDNVELIRAIKLILFQQRSKSIHAAAVVIIPKTSNSIFESIPVRLEDNMLISEWDKHDIESAGYLKEDILGLNQLDKLNAIIKLVKKNKEIDLPFFDIDTKDEDTYKYFQQGWNEDVFQFSTHGLKDYCIKLHPDNIEDLVAANALYRPGAMDSDAHLDYIDIKFGIKKAEYDKHLEEFTKDTFGLYIYQEQVMMLFQKAADCTLTEADNFRKMISKSYLERDEKKIAFNKNLFITGYTKKGVTEEYANNVWEKMIAFALYSFNKSHAAAYAVIGYACQYYKVHYPLEFWTTSLDFCKNSSEINRKLEEIQKTGNIKVIQPDINQSTEKFEIDYIKNTIYWSIGSIKFLAEKGIQFILEERSKGKFKSFADFIKRCKGSTVNSRIITNLIICGLFDEVEDLNQPAQRYNLLRLFYESLKDKDIDEIIDPKLANKNYYWGILSKDICGYGYIDYERLIKESNFIQKYMSNEQILEYDTNNGVKEIVCCGMVMEFKEFNTKKGKAAKVVLNNNGFSVTTTLWNNVYEPLKPKLAKNIILCVTGDLMLDTFNGNYKNILQSNKNSKFQVL